MRQLSHLGVHEADHLQIEAVERLGPVQQDRPGGALVGEYHGSVRGMRSMLMRFRLIVVTMLVVVMVAAGRQQGGGVHARGSGA